MKAAVLQFFSWPDRTVPLATVYERAFQRIDVMDRTGYDAVWLAEHHFSGYSVCPSIHLMGSHIAARTKNLRIGTAVSLAALYHPLRLAEEVALLDHLSDGRVNWGAGRGFDPTEFRTFAVPKDESADRFRECVEIVLAAWRSERLDYDGRFWRFEDVEVLPKPKQKPHPPVWMAASSEQAIRWAGGAGHSILMDPHSSHQRIAEKRELYRQVLETSGFSIEGRELPVARLLAVASTESEAEEIARRGAAWMVGAYVQQSISNSGPGPRDSDFDARSFDDPVARYLEGVIIYGTPSSVIDQIERLREEASLDYLLCAPLSHGSFELFTDEVLPRLP